MNCQGRSSANPWLNLRVRRGQYIHEDDRPYIEAFNQLTASEDGKLITSAVPQPWAGPVDTAKVLILMANPGWSNGDSDAERPLARLLRQNLTGNSPMLWLDSKAANTPGGRWARSRLRPVLDELSKNMDRHVADAVLAESVAFVDFHAYHSSHHAALPVTLPTQWYTFDRVRDRIFDGAMVILARSRREWQVAVPELQAHRSTHRTRSVQQVQISPRNLEQAAWRELMDRLYAVHRCWFGG